MDFDIDALVRLCWRGVPTIHVPVRVTYPAGNTSNFDYLRDNWRITKLHTRLVLAMLPRVPLILARRRPPAHWAALAERGARWGLAFVAATYRHLGRRGCALVLAPVALYFYCSGREQRRAFRTRGEERRPSWHDGVRHMFDFACKALETVAAWSGNIGHERLEIVGEAALREATAESRGLVLIVSHLGNVELSRALLDPERRSRLTVLVHTRHAENYNRVLRDFRADAALNTIQVSELTPATAAQLHERIERGEWIAIAGDRVPLSGDARASVVRFLGDEAALPQGPYILAHLLRCPVYLMFCLRESGRWRAYFEKFADRVELPRMGKDEALRGLAQRYAARLESYCLRAPFQWYNFFDFWAAAPRREPS
jgi:predicted LPLAT superfamily acyltransferase